MEKWLFLWRSRCCGKAKLHYRDRKGGKKLLLRAQGGSEEGLRDAELCLCVCKIPLCPTFAASGSAGKGSRPMDLGPDYKPPLGGECGAKLLYSHTWVPVWGHPENIPTAVPEVSLLLLSFHGISITRAAPSVV